MYRRIKRRNRASIAVAHRSYSQTRTSPRCRGCEALVSGAAQAWQPRRARAAFAAGRRAGFDAGDCRCGLMGGGNASGTFEGVRSKTWGIRTLVHATSAFGRRRRALRSKKESPDPLLEPRGGRGYWRAGGSVWLGAPVVAGRSGPARREPVHSCGGTQSASAPRLDAGRHRVLRSFLLSLHRTGPLLVRLAGQLLVRAVA